MQNSKIIQFLKTLSPLDMNRFEKFVNSPYFNSHEDTIRLFRILKQAYPAFSERRIQKEKLFKKLFPHQPYNAGKLNTLNKYLAQLFTDFVVQEEIRLRQEDQRKLWLLEGFTVRDLHKFIPRIVQEAEAEYQTYSYRDATYFYNRFRLEEIITQLTLSLDNRSSEVGMQLIMENLDYFYLIHKLRYACAIINRQRFLAEKSQIHLLEEINSYCQRLAPETAPVVYMYFQTLLMIRDSMEEAYQKLKEALSSYYALIPREEAINLYSFMINFCNLKYKEGNEVFLSEMFEIYKQMLAKDLLFISPAVTSIHYKNLVSLGLKLSQYDWTEEFIHTYKSHLDPTFREGVVQYNLANLFFHQGAYRKAVRSLQQVEFIDSFYRVNYQLLLLKTYFECDDIEALLSLCNTFTMYIRRNKSMSESNQKAHIGFAKFVRRLARIKYGSPKPIQGLKAEVEAFPALIERKWLMEKIGELV